ncbi:MAG: hypothetical protein ACXVC6_04510 [Bacteroidia bacterium]
MQQEINKAIKERIVIQFIYDEERVVVEPFIIGYQKYSSSLMLLGYKILSTPTERPWKLYSIKDISELELINLKAYTYRGGIRRYTNKFDTIITSPNRFNEEVI